MIEFMAALALTAYIVNSLVYRHRKRREAARLKAIESTRPERRNRLVNPSHAHLVGDAFDRAIYGFSPNETTPAGHFQRDAGPFRLVMPCPACRDYAAHHIIEPQPGTWHRNYDVVRACRVCDHQWGHR